MNKNQKKNVALCSIDVAYTSYGHKCQFCDNVYKHHSSLYRHQKDCKHKESKYLNNNIKSNLVKINTNKTCRTYKCPENDKNMSSLNKSYICKFCQNSYLNCRSLSKHIRTCSVRVLMKKKI